MQRTKDGDAFQEGGANDQAVALACHLDFACFFSFLFLAILLLAFGLFSEAFGFFIARRVGAGGLGRWLLGRGGCGGSGCGSVKSANARQFFI